MAPWPSPKPPRYMGRCLTSAQFSRSQTACGATIAAATGKPLTIYGDGKQVRDVLFVEDLVRALRLAADRIDLSAGQVYNVGGGSRNALAVWHEFGPILEELSGTRLTVAFDKWRTGDQRCYISDIQKIGRHLGWQPRIDATTGITRLWEWVSANRELFGVFEGAGAGASLAGTLS